MSQDSLVQLIELTRRLAAPFDLGELLEQILHSGQDLLDADSGSLWLLDQNTDTLRMHLPAFEPMVEVMLGQGLVGQCLAQEEIINVPDCYSDPRFNQAVDKASGYKTNSLLSIPLLGLDKSKIGVMQLLNKKGGPFTAEDELMATGLAAQCAMALQRSQMTKALIAKERRDEEVYIATKMQHATLPSRMPEVDGYEFHGTFKPAEYTGGDLYDLVAIEDKVFILLGDATGHGFGPALSATQMHAMLRVSFRQGAHLDTAYIHVNNHLCASLPDDKFITAFVGFLDPASNTVTYHSGGQGPILHYRAADKSCDFRKPTLFPMGVMDVDDSLESASMHLEAGDILALISDGIYESNNPDGEEFGETRVAQLFAEHSEMPLKKLADLLLTRVSEFSDGVEQADDVTLVLVGRRK